MENQNENFKGKGALDAFLNLFVLIFLGWLAMSIGMILFGIIDRVFDAGKFAGLSYDVYSQAGLKGGIASVIIILPVFLIVINVLHKQYKKKQLNNTSGIHRWLTYLMLLVSAITVIGSLVSLIVNLLNGEYAANVILKIITVLVVALIVFGYFGYDLRRKDYSKRSMISLIALIVALIFGIGSIIGGVMFIDSPKTSKLKRFDLTRSNDLGSMNSYIVSKYISDKKLPDVGDAKLNNFKDPETKTPYEYSVIGPDQYQICANFAFAVNDNNSQPQGMDDWYSHLAGHQCFQKKAVEINNGSPVQAVPLTK